MRITVLGKSPAWQDAGGACSGYLVETDGTRVLLDCGPGVFSALRSLRDYGSVDAVVISHLHADHVLDLVPYASALAYSPRGAAGELRRPPLHVPPHGADHLAAITVAGGMRAEHVERPFALREYQPDETLTVGDLRVRFQPVPHYIPSNAVELTDGQVRFTFGGDCGPSTALAEFARETDLLMVEATLPEPDSEPRGHLTAYEAGEHGRRAAARRVVVTHWSDELDPEVIRAEAERGFGGAVELAADGAVYEVKVHRPAADAVK